LNILFPNRPIERENRPSWKRMESEGSTTSGGRRNGRDQKRGRNEERRKIGEPRGKKSISFQKLNTHTEKGGESRRAHGKKRKKKGFYVGCAGTHRKGGATSLQTKGYIGKSRRVVLSKREKEGPDREACRTVTLRRSTPSGEKEMCILNPKERNQKRSKHWGRATTGAPTLKSAQKKNTRCLKRSEESQKNEKRLLGKRGGLPQKKDLKRGGVLPGKGRGGRVKKGSGKLFLGKKEK